MISLIQARIQELEGQHGGLRKAARALKIDPAYLSRLKAGDKTNPSNNVLKKLGLRKIVKIERIF